jgi:hypothetical protein
MLPMRGLQDALPHAYYHIFTIFPANLDLQYCLLQAP